MAQSNVKLIQDLCKYKHELVILTQQGIENIVPKINENQYTKVKNFSFKRIDLLSNLTRKKWLQHEEEFIFQHIY